MAPLGVFHCATQDTQISKFNIPKGSWICVNQYHILNDPEVWEDPENFRPERFLSEDGKSVVKNEAMCIFSFGPRRCVGEQVARDTLFLFVSSVCQRFILKSDPKLQGVPSLEASTWLHAPNKFNIVAIDRLNCCE